MKTGKEQKTKTKTYSKVALKMVSGTVPKNRSPGKVAAEKEMLLREGIAVYEELQTKLSDYAERAKSAITDIKTAIDKAGAESPSVNQALSDTNKMVIFKTKLDKYLAEAKDQTNPLDKRIAIIGVVAELTEDLNIPQFNNDTSIEG